MFAKFIFYVFLLFFIYDGVCAENPDLLEKWNLANKLYKEAQSSEQYLEVVGYYEYLLKEGVKNGYLYYNLGNAYLKAERLDYAILNYKRAERYIPNNINLLQNLHLANTRLHKKVDFGTNDQESIFKYLFFWHFNWKYDTRLLLFSIAYIFLWSLLLIKLTRWKLPFFNLLFIVVILLVGLGGSLYYDIFNVQEKGILIGEEIEVRKGNAQTHGLLYEQKIYGGVEVEILEVRDNWIKVKLPDNEEGWVKNNSVEKI